MNDAWRRGSPRSVLALLILFLVPSLAPGQTNSTVGCKPEPKLELSAKREINGLPGEREWDDDNVSFSNTGLDLALRERIQPSSTGTEDSGFLKNAETQTSQKVTTDDVAGKVTGKLTLHAKSLIYLWAEDNDTLTRSTKAQSQGTIKIETLCDPLTLHAIPPKGSNLFVAVSEPSGRFRMEASPHVRKVGTVRLDIRKAWATPDEVFEVDIHDTLQVTTTQTVSASLNLDGSIRETASIPFAGGLAASTIRSLLGLGGVLTHSFKVTTVQSAAINQDKVLDFNRTEVTRRTQCHGNSDSTEPSVQTHVNLAIYSNPSSDEGIATAELWGTEVITIVGTPETACGVNTGTSTPGGGGPTGGPDPTPTQGGTGNTSVPPLPVPPPIGGPTREGLPLPPPKEGATKDQGRRSPDLRNPAYSVGSSHRVAAQANPVEDFRRSAWFGLLVEEKYAGHPCMPFYVRVAPDQIGVTFASMGTAYQTQVGREKVQIPIEPTVPIELTPGIWLLEFPFQGGDPGWVRFQASFDPTFPEGNTATNHAELLAQGFTLGEFRPGSHLEPRIEHRALIRAAGTLPEYAPLSRVCNSLDFTTLTMSWEQVSGGTVDWQSPPRIVLDPLFDQAAIIWKASVPPGPNAILHVTVSDGTVPITFELSLGHSGS